MVQRVQVQNPVAPPALQPVASPTNQFFVPKIPAPQMAPIIDLAPLSASLAAIQDQQQQRDAQEAASLGAKGASIAPPDVLDQIASASKDLDTAEAKKNANQDAYAKAVASGQITGSQNPWSYVGFQQVAARRDMGKYSDELNSKLSQVSDLIDPKTGLFKNPTSADQIIQETWDKYKGSGAFTDHYGGQVMTDMKLKTEAAFRTQASQKLASAMDSYHTELVSNEIGRAVSAWSDRTIDANDLQVQQEAVAKYMTDDVYRMGVANVRGTFMQGLKAATHQVAVTDPAGAANILRNAKDVKINGVRVGDDANLSPEINERIRTYDDMQERDDRQKAEQAHVQLGADQLDGRQKVYKAIADEHAQGAAPGSVSQAVIDDALKTNAWGKNTGIVADDMKKVAYGTQADDLKVKSAIDQGILKGQDPAVLQGFINSSVDNGSLTATSALALTQDLKKRSDITPLIEQNPTVETLLNDAFRSWNVAGLTPALTEERAAQFEDKKNSLMASVLVPYAKSIATNPNASELMRQKVQEVRGDFLTDLRKSATDLTTQITEANKEIEDRMAHEQDATDLLNKYGKYFGDQRLATLTSLNLSKSSPETWMRSPAYLSNLGIVMKSVDSAVETEEGKGGKIQPDFGAMHEEFMHQFEDKAAAWRADNLGKLTPAAITSAFRSAMTDIADELVGKVTGSNIGKVLSEQMRGGKSAKAVLGEEAANTADRTQAVRSTDPKLDADGITDVLMPVAAKNPNVSSDLYHMQRAFMSRSLNYTVFQPADVARDGAPATPFGRVSQDQLRERVNFEASRVALRTDMSDQDKSAAYLKLLGPLGVNYRDVLTGQTTITLPDATRAGVKAELDRTLAQSKAFSNVDSVRWYDRKIQSLQAVLANKGTTVDLKSANINPFTTPLADSLDELKGISTNDMKALAEKFGIPSDDKSLKEFVYFQKLAVGRKQAAIGQ